MGRHITYITLILSWAWVASAHAQQIATTITPTAGAGDLGTKVTQAGNSFDITGGIRPSNGPNLFHSFDQLSLGRGDIANDIANFANDTGLATQNILSRVTGGSRSDIFGTVKTTGFPGADLFLLNPAGVVFGPNASLDVGGSFHVSTADFIELADGVRFGALPSANDALLTTAPPAAFGFLREQPAAIAFRGNGSGSEPGFAVPEHETLSVIGGDVEITGAAMLKAPGGRVNLASLAAAGKVKLGNTALEAESSGPLGTITMQQDSTLDVSERQGGTTGGGSVFIRAGHFVVDDSKILANTVNGDSEGIDIELTEAMRMTNESSFEARTSGPGKGGKLNIQAKEVLLEGGSRLDGCSAESGECLKPGNVCLSCGDAGNVAINTGRLQLTGGSRINANTQTPGNAGNVTINASEEVALMDGSQVQTEARLRGERGLLPAVLGNAGSIVINTGRLELNRSSISALTSGDGKGGIVKITAKEVLLKGRLELDNRVVRSSLGATTDAGRGEGGEIIINTERLSLADGATIRTRSNGPGNGGDVTITAKDQIVLDGGSDLQLRTQGMATFCGQDCGDAGDLLIETDRLRLAGGSRIDAGTQGPGNGGNVTIRARDIVLEGESKLDAIAGPGNRDPFCPDCGGGAT